METTNLEKTIGQIFDGSNRYVVPLYQRNFAWRQEQIEQLLQDVYVAFLNNPQSHYFIGSLIVLKRSNGEYEVIDGQQRLTTLSLITRIMGIDKEPRLYYDSRPEVEAFFDEFYKSDNNDVNFCHSQIAHLKDAIEIINNADLDPETLGVKWFMPKGYKDYFKNNVYLVMVEIPADTDVASYFEIMNNRGEQLQKHEILKSLMIGKLHDSISRNEFALIWNACSQMDVPIQKLFGVEQRVKYFGQGYVDFIFSGLGKGGTASVDKEWSIEEILSNSLCDSYHDNTEHDDEPNEDELEYKSIIDFPNFLMHVFKIMFPNRNVKLNEKYLLSTYYEIKDKIDIDQFIKTLFFCRLVFDRYVVKTINDNKDSEDGEKWTLRMPKRYETSWKYIDTFGDEPRGQERVVKALSMLQVTYRTRIYKNWLYLVLKWFVDKNSICVCYAEYIQELDRIICSGLDNQMLNWKAVDGFTQDNNYKEGTNTPHFLLNFIDYLYWVDSKCNDKQFASSENVKDFDFKYWNSVEHHMAREWAERNNVANRANFIDNLGNLCLISRSSNSRLSDRDVKEKVETFGQGNLGANRQIMYKMTQNNNDTWNEEQIRQHYNELLGLLNFRNDILRNY